MITDLAVTHFGRLWRCVGGLLLVLTWPSHILRLQTLLLNIDSDPVDVSLPTRDYRRRC